MKTFSTKVLTKSYQISKIPRGRNLSLYTFRRPATCIPQQGAHLTAHFNIWQQSQFFKRIRWYTLF